MSVNIFNFRNFCKFLLQKISFSFNFTNFIILIILSIFNFHTKSVFCSHLSNFTSNFNFNSNSSNSLGGGGNFQNKFESPWKAHLNTLGAKFPNILKDKFYYNYLSEENNKNLKKLIESSDAGKLNTLNLNNQNIINVNFHGGSSGSSSENSRKSANKIYIAGFFPMTNALGHVGRGVYQAVRLALHHINQNQDILQDYFLDIEWDDTKCDAAEGMKSFFDMMHNKPYKLFLFGDACTQVTDPIAKASKHWKVVQLSYADMHPMFSAKSYPNLFRIVPSENEFNPPRIELLKKFNWTRVGTIYQNQPRYSLAHNKLVSELDKINVEVVAAQSFADDDLSQQLEQLKQKEVRIILGNFNETWARKIFCEAYHQKLYGRKYQWLLVATYSQQWWRKNNQNLNCTLDQLEYALKGAILMDLLPLSSSNEMTISGMTASEYKDLYEVVRLGEYSRFHGYAYDGIWAISLALNNITQYLNNQQRGGSYNNFDNNSNNIEYKMKDKNTKEGSKDDLVLLKFAYHDERWERAFLAALEATSFIGVTGPVRFRDNGRKGTVLIKQFQAFNTVNAEVKVGEFDGVTQTLSLNKGQQEIVWNGVNPPKDRTYKLTEHTRINVTLFIALSIMSIIGIILAILFLVINIKFRNQRYIKMSSPNLNNLIIIGCILTYLSVIVLGIDSNLSSIDAFPYICTARAWVLMAGFTLAFGSMFSKTWRVHSIFTNVKLNKKVIKDTQLYIVVGILLAIDFTILTTWQFVDPFFRETKLMEGFMDPKNEDVEIIPQNEYCKSHYMNIFVGCIYAYKGLLMMFGCFLAWETRQVNIPALNDSKYIGMSVYNSVMMCLIGAPLSHVLSDKQDASFGIISIFIIFCTTGTLCLVFLPKLIELKRNPKGTIEKRLRATIKPNFTTGGGGTQSSTAGPNNNKENDYCVVTTTTGGGAGGAGRSNTKDYGSTSDSHHHHSKDGKKRPQSKNTGGSMTGKDSKSQSGSIIGGSGRRNSGVFENDLRIAKQTNSRVRRQIREIDNEIQAIAKLLYDDEKAQEILHDAMVNLAIPKSEINKKEDTDISSLYSLNSEADDNYDGQQVVEAKETLQLQKKEDSKVSVEDECVAVGVVNQEKEKESKDVVTAHVNVNVAQMALKTDIEKGPMTMTIEKDPKPPEIVEDVCQKQDMSDYYIDYYGDEKPPLSLSKMEEGDFGDDVCDEMCGGQEYYPSGIVLSTGSNKNLIYLLNEEAKAKGNNNSSSNNNNNIGKNGNGNNNGNGNGNSNNNANTNANLNNANPNTTPEELWNLIQKDNKKYYFYNSQNYDTSSIEKDKESIGSGSRKYSCSGTKDTGAGLKVKDADTDAVRKINYRTSCEFNVNEEDDDKTDFNYYYCDYFGNGNGGGNGNGSVMKKYKSTSSIEINMRGKKNKNKLSPFKSKDSDKIDIDQEIDIDPDDTPLGGTPLVSTEALDYKKNTNELNLDVSLLPIFQKLINEQKQSRSKSLKFPSSTGVSVGGGGGGNGNNLKTTASQSYQHLLVSNTIGGSKQPGTNYKNLGANKKETDGVGAGVGGAAKKDGNKFGMNLNRSCPNIFIKCDIVEYL